MRKPLFSNLKQTEILDSILINYKKSSDLKLFVEDRYQYLKGADIVYQIYAFFNLLYDLKDEYVDRGFNKENFIKTYKRFRAKDSTILDEILERNLDNACSYCLVETADTLDHYLPKEKYPSYAISFSNLVPSCHTCNRIKGEVIPIKESRLLHPNFDTFHSIIMNVEFIDDFKSIKYSISPRNHHFKLIDNTYTQLKIFELIELEAHKELINVLRDVIEEVNLDMQGFFYKKYLNSRKGPNHWWRLALYRNLSENLEFQYNGYQKYWDNYIKLNSQNT